MERGTMSEQRNPDGMNLVQHGAAETGYAPARITLSQVKYAIDRIVWLHENRKLIEGLTWVEEPQILRFFFGRLKPVSNWQKN